MLKAYQISGETMDGNCCELVFAENANQARALHRYTGGLADLEYIEISAKRIKEADSYAHLTKGGVVPYGSSAELFRNILGWIEFDKDWCETCGKTDYDQPEYFVEECGHCRDCGCDCEQEVGEGES